MYKAEEFVRWALSHAKRESIPPSAVLALPRERCGTEPWQYLFGSVRVRTDDAALDLYYENRYKKQMTRARYDVLTADWDRSGFATDCQGLLDAWLTYEKGERTDINADMNYRLWCGEKGPIAGGVRPLAVGEAVFRMGGSGRMTHVGWICGHDADGTPLVVEARGIAYGVVVTRLTERDFTHRGLMTARFTYGEEQEDEMETIIFKEAKPMPEGGAYRAMQAALNEAGYRDAQGNELEEDGKWGAKSAFAFAKLLAAHAQNGSADGPADSPVDGIEDGSDFTAPVVLTVNGVRVTVESVQ